MSETDLDQNTAMQNLIETGDAEQVAMILGHKDRLRCGGIIRTGIQFPNSKCTEKERAIYNEMDAQGIGYDTINRAMGGEPKTRTSKLVPKNVDYFVVRECDFTRPADAKFIRDKFADPDGKVRRFPVWFSIGDISKVIPHGFTCFSGSSLAAASFYEKSHLMIKYLPKGFQGPAKSKDYLIADFDPDNGPLSSKEKPLSPGGHEMLFGGFFRFNIPGLKGFDEIMIPTRSWFGMSYSVALLRRCRAVLGRFDGLLNGDHFFEMVKSPEEMTHDGKRVTQFIPVLELSKDPIELARYAEPAAVTARARHAMSALAGPRMEVEIRSPAMPVPVEDEAPLSAADALDDSAAEDGADPFFGEPDPARTTAIEYLHRLAKELNVSWPQFATWAHTSLTDGVDVDKCSLDLLREVASLAKEGLIKDRAMMAKVITLAAAQFGVE